MNAWGMIAELPIAGYPYYYTATPVTQVYVIYRALLGVGI